MFWKKHVKLTMTLFVLLAISLYMAQSAFAGSIVGWGRMAIDSTELDAKDFIAIAAGDGHSLALKTDGSIVGWGRNNYGQATPPDGDDFVAIAAGGCIYTWPTGLPGVHLSHSLALRSDGSIVGWGNNYWGQAVPPDGNDFVAIAAGYWHSLALRSDGSIVGWGQSDYGQTTLPEGDDFVAIAAGRWHSLALKSDGSIVGWGANWYGQATPPEGNDFVAISDGGYHSLALKSDGSIVAWGVSDGGWCDYGQVTDTPACNDFMAIAAGEYHSLALKSDGSIVGWGEDCYGQATPPGGNDFVAITAGNYHSLAIKSDGSIVGWGDNMFGEAMPQAGSDFVAASAGGYKWCHDSGCFKFMHSLALKSDGSIAGWGADGYGQATPPIGKDFVDIGAGGCHSLALKSDGSIVGWGDNYDYLGNWCGQATPPAGNDFVAITAGEYHSLALKSDSSIVGWGWDEYGQATPPEGNDFVAISAGYGHSMALKSDGSIVGWGRDMYGQATPPEGNDFVAIATGGYFSLALRSDGSIVGWGSNWNGQATPPDGNEYVVIAAGGHHSLALKSDGSIVGWGSNYKATPPAGNDFVAIAAGPYHSLAIKREPIEAQIKLTPKTANFNSKGKWMAVFLWLPEDFNVADIDPNSVFLEGKIQAEPLYINEQKQIAMAKFSREEVRNILNIGIGEVELTITGWLTDGTKFEGRDVIRVINKEGGGKPDKYVKASDPNPADGATGLSINTDLTWTAGPYVTSHDVYFGTSSLPSFVCNQTYTTFDPGTMDYDTTYYWRIDEVNKWGKTTGEVWSFTTFRPPPPLFKATDPNPLDGSIFVPTTADLSWTAGFDATSHDVYFGTSSTLPFVCNQTTTTFDPGTMDYDTTYHWRIDEVNNWGKNTGEVWSFTISPPPPSPPP